MTALSTLFSWTGMLLSTHLSNILVFSIILAVLLFTGNPLAMLGLLLFREPSPYAMMPADLAGVDEEDDGPGIGFTANI